MHSVFLCVRMSDWLDGCTRHKRLNCSTHLIHFRYLSVKGWCLVNMNVLISKISALHRAPMVH
jgi:hypothetical protein